MSINTLYLYGQDTPLAFYIPAIPPAVKYPSQGMNRLNKKTKAEKRTDLGNHRPSARVLIYNLCGLMTQS